MTVFSLMRDAQVLRVRRAGRRWRMPLVLARSRPRISMPVRVAVGGVGGHGDGVGGAGDLRLRAGRHERAEPGHGQADAFAQQLLAVLQRDAAGQRRRGADAVEDEDGRGSAPDAGSGARPASRTASVERPSPPAALFGPVWLFTYQTVAPTVMLTVPGDRRHRIGHLDVERVDAGEARVRHIGERAVRVSERAVPGVGVAPRTARPTAARAVDVRPAPTWQQRRSRRRSTRGPRSVAPGHVQLRVADRAVGDRRRW